MTDHRPPSQPPVDPALFRAAMRLPATSVTIIATGRGDDRAGLTASAVCSLSDAPPMILACINRRSPALELIRRNGAFSANFLASHQPDMAELFAGRTGVYGADRFASGGWETGVTGMPVLPAALASFDCLLEAEHDSPTHAILIGRVAGILQNAAQPALIYSVGAFGRPAGLAQPAL